jgi:protein-tyrosine phosphatase
MIDIHAHIIPGVDDGPLDMETSVGMGEIAQREGIHGIISTSHSKEASAIGYTQMQTRLEAVRMAWHKAGLNIRLQLGVEIFLQPDTLDDLKAGRLWTLAGSRYVLVELPYQPWPQYAEETLFALQVAGYVPILAHPERYTAIQAEPGRMYELAARGVLGQVTAMALLGEQGHATRKCAEALVRHNLVQFIATDAHRVAWRSPKVSAALMIAEDMVGLDAVQAMAEGNPARVLANEEIVAEPLRPAPHKGLFGTIFGR